MWRAVPGLLLFAACAHTPAPGAASADWLPENEARLTRLRGPGVAAFDWDNTVMKNDIGDATLWWMLRNDRVLQPPGKDWGQSSRWLTAEAKAALNAACDGAAEAGQPLATATTPACADEIYVIAEDGKTMAGAPAWTTDVTPTNKASYLWTAQLTAGYRAGDVRDFARAAFFEATLAPIGTKQTIGTHRDVVAWARVYPQMRALIETLKQHGLDVWVVSASPQLFAEVVAASVGIAADHVIGIRSLVDDREKMTPHVQGCGLVADGEDTLITFNEGKRCWINKVIFGVDPAMQQTRLPPPQRPLFAAGDSDTDVSFVKDAGLKLVIDRQRPELMCNARNNHGGSWLIQPMFLGPLPPRAAPYACGQFRDEADQPIADQ